MPRDRELTDGIGKKINAVLHKSQALQFDIEHKRQTQRITLPIAGWPERSIPTVVHPISYYGTVNSHLLTIYSTSTSIVNENAYYGACFLQLPRLMCSNG